MTPFFLLSLLISPALCSPTSIPASSTQAHETSPSATPAASPLGKQTTVIITPFPWWWPGIIIPPKYEEPEDPRNADTKWGTPVSPPMPKHTPTPLPAPLINGTERDEGSRWWHEGDATNPARPATPAARKAIHPDKLSKYESAGADSGIRPEHKQAMANYRAWYAAGNNPASSSATPSPTWAATIPSEVASNDFKSAFRGVKFPGVRRRAETSFERVVGEMGRRAKWGGKTGGEPAGAVVAPQKTKPTGTPQEVAVQACDAVFANAKPQGMGLRRVKRDAADTVVDGWGMMRQGRKMQKLVDAVEGEEEPVGLERPGRETQPNQKAAAAGGVRRKMQFTVRPERVLGEEVGAGKGKRELGADGRYEDLSGGEGAGVSKVTVVLIIWIAVFAVVGVLEAM